MSNDETEIPALIPRKNGEGFYEEGDRVIAVDIVGGNVERIGTVGQTGTDGTGARYMVVRHGDEPFIGAFLCGVGDVVQDLPRDNTTEAIERWLEKESS